MNIIIHPDHGEFSSFNQNQYFSSDSKDEDIKVNKPTSAASTASGDYVHLKCPNKKRR